MSALSAGVAFVPLLEAIPDGARIAFDTLLFQSHFEIVVPSSISRKKSPSHQTAKLICEGLLVVICTPLQVNKPPREDHASYPRVRGSMSMATPRPTSAP